MTATSAPRKKEPSHVAHAEIPRLRYLASPGSPVQRASAPVHTTTALASIVPFIIVSSFLTSPEKSTD